jgi:tol-pal system protein YbgF
MRRFRIIVPALLALCVGFGCASTVKNRPNAEASASEKQDDALRAALELIDRNSAAIRDGRNEVAALEQRLKKLEARVDSLSAAADSSLGELRENVSFLTAQIQRLDSAPRETKPAPAASAPKKTGVFKPEGKTLRNETTVSSAPKSAGVFKPDGYDVQSSYRSALDQYRAKKYDAAIAAFSEIIAVSPTNSLADNAQYWIGECWYMVRNYEKSLQAFNRVFTFRNTNKGADAHLKIGMIYQLMNNPDAAREELKSVVREYPASDAAKIASAKLQSLGK